MTFNPGDIILLRARAEFAVQGGIQIVYTGADGHEARTKIASSEVEKILPGPLKGGDPVTMKKGKTTLAGTVKHRDAERAWVTWADASDSVEDVASLTRA